MVVKAKLKIRLLADDVEIAESEDENLWRKVLAAIQSGANSTDEQTDLIDEPVSKVKRHPRSGGGIAAFAGELDSSAEVIEGACSPTSEEPFLHLDDGFWESFRKNTGQRGPGAVSSGQLASTLLCLWFKHAGMEGHPTQKQAQLVLGTIGERDKNISRSIKNCDWLQTRGGGLRINAARYSRAIAVAKAYVNETAVGAD